MVDLALLLRRAVALPNIASFAIGFALFSAFVLTLQDAAAPASSGVGTSAGAAYGLVASPTATGLLLTPATVAMMLAAPITGRAGVRFAFRDLLAFGLMVTALARV